MTKLPKISFWIANRSIKFGFCLAATIFFITNCSNDSDFGAGPAQSTPVEPKPKEAPAAAEVPEEPPKPPPPVAKEPPPEKCDDSINRTTLTAPIKKCMDAGKLFDFATGNCAKMSLASESDFKCDYENFTGKLTSIGIPDAQLEFIKKNIQDQGFKILGCGVAHEGNALMLQALKSQAGTCEFSESASIFTGCYLSSTVPGFDQADLSSEEGMRQWNLKCLNSL